MSEIVCPFCFEKFKASDVEFRCSNYGGCTQEDDKTLAKFWQGTQFTIKTGKVAKPVQGLMGRLAGKAPEHGVCPSCRQKTFVTICPKCHNRIPSEMVRKKGFIISIIGARSSGKTIYITTLINELMRHGYNLGNLGITAVNVTDDPAYNTQSRYKNDFFDVIYKNKTLPGNTNATDVRNRIPLIYELSKPKTKPVYLVFYDTAGENFNDPKKIPGNVKFLEESDAVIFLLDTFEVPYVQEKLGISQEGLRYNFIVDNLHTHFNNGDPALRDRHFAKPMALVFSKIDAILSNEDKFEDTAIAGMSIANNSNFLNGDPVNLSDFDSVSVSLQGALASWQENNFLQIFSNFYKKVKFFGISSLGSEPVGQSIKSVKPYRVLDPLVWILHELGYPLPVTK